jgi:hypothetical protein
MSILGKLSWNAIPHDPIVFGGILTMVVVGLAGVAAIG